MGDLPSGRFVLRIDPDLHARLREAARRAGISLNEYCSRRLAFPEPGLGKAAREAVERAAALFGDALVAVVGFGSWARDELSENSDVDLLVVVEPEVAITRDLYRKWDQRELTWGGHPVEPHFVRLPRPGSRFSGVWAEAAVDGVVLFDRDLLVSRRLVELRRRIAEREIIRRESHGQAYWVEAA